MPPDIFENAMKFIVVMGTGAFVLMMVGLGVKLLFFRKPRPAALEGEQLEGLDDRLLRTEAKMAELEERLDFAERMLADARSKAQLPGKP